ncbi:MAG: ATP synthase F1 subunit epsilon [Bryobacteraceae bacterium]
MAETFQIEVVTPEKLVLDQQAEYAEIPGKDGYLGVLPGHAALLGELGAGVLKITSGGQTREITVSGGYVEVRDNHVRVLADKAG